MTREWTLQRNCSLSPRQVARAYTVLCLGSLVVGQRKEQGLDQAGHNVGHALQCLVDQGSVV